jgi:hypothetical protein
LAKAVRARAATKMGAREEMRMTRDSAARRSRKRYRR